MKKRLHRLLEMMPTKQRNKVVNGFFNTFSYIYNEKITAIDYVLMYICEDGSELKSLSKALKAQKIPVQRLKRLINWLGEAGSHVDDVLCNIVGVKVPKKFLTSTVVSGGARKRARGSNRYVVRTNKNRRRSRSRSKIKVSSGRSKKNRRRSRS